MKTPAPKLLVKLVYRENSTGKWTALIYHPTQSLVHHVLIPTKMQKKLHSPRIEDIIGVERIRITANTENVDDKFPGNR